jgi:hypothetical protein
MFSVAIPDRSAAVVFGLLTPKLTRQRQALAVRLRERAHEARDRPGKRAIVGIARSCA